MKLNGFWPVVAVLMVMASTVIAVAFVGSGDSRETDDPREAASAPNDSGSIINGTEVTLAYDGPNSTEPLCGGLPQAYSDTGPNETNLMRMDGTVTFNVTYRGTGELTVTLLDATGSAVAVLADESFDFYGKHSLTVDLPDLEPGAYRVSVEASGYWFISIA